MTSYSHLESDVGCASGDDGPELGEEASSFSSDDASSSYRSVLSKLSSRRLTSCAAFTGSSDRSLKRIGTCTMSSANQNERHKKTDNKN